MIFFPSSFYFHSFVNINFRTAGADLLNKKKMWDDSQREQEGCGSEPTSALSSRREMCGGVLLTNESSGTLNVSLTVSSVANPFCPHYSNAYVIHISREARVSICVWGKNWLMHTDVLVRGARVEAQGRYGNGSSFPSLWTGFKLCIS